MICDGRRRGGDSGANEESDLRVMRRGHCRDTAVSTAAATDTDTRRDDRRRSRDSGVDEKGSSRMSRQLTAPTALLLSIVETQRSAP